MFVDDVLTAGQKFPAIGSHFPFPFTVVRVNPVKPEFTIREMYPDWQQFERVVRFSVFSHACRVWKIRLTPGKGFSSHGAA